MRRVLFALPGCRCNGNVPSSYQIERGPNCGSMSLPYAVTCDYLDPMLRASVADLLASWQRPAMNAPEIQAWILQVLGYFHDC